MDKNNDFKRRETEADVPIGTEKEIAKFDSASQFTLTISTLLFQLDSRIARITWIFLLER